MANIARWCFRHKYIIIGIWILALVASFGFTRAYGTNYSNSFSLRAPAQPRLLVYYKPFRPVLLVKPILLFGMLAAERCVAL